MFNNCLNSVTNIQILTVSFIIFLLVLTLTNVFPPVWLLLIFELIFFQIIILFLIKSTDLFEIQGYLLAYSLVVSISIESATLLGILLILNKIISKF